MAFVLTYIDPSIASASGTGTIGDPYGDIQHALDTAVAGANGNVLNIKAGTSEILAAALDFSTFGAPTSTNPCIIRGYTSASEDGGQGSIDANSFSLLNATTYDHLFFIDMELFNFGTSEPIHFDVGCGLINCEIHTTAHTSFIIDFNIGGTMRNCYVHSLTGTGVVVLGTSRCDISSNFFDLGGSRTGGVLMNSTGGNVSKNDFKSSNAGLSYAISANGSGITVENNSIWNSAACTGDGIQATSASAYIRILNNIIEGFSGTGGQAIASISAAMANVIAGNQFYNCTSNIVETNPTIFKTANVALGASPFADPANDDFTVDTTVKGVAWPLLIGGVAASPTYLDAGACQREEAGGGAASILGGGNLSGNFNE